MKKIVPIALLCLIPFSACQKNEPAPTVKSDQKTATTPEDTPKATQRIVSLGGGVTETLYALGVGEQIVATDVSSLYPEQSTKLPKVGYIRATSAEGIASMKPDIVIASDALGPATVKEQLKTSGVRLALVPEAKSIESAAQRIRELGAIVGKKDKAETLAKAVETIAAKPNPKTKAPRILFLFGHGGTSLMAAGNNTGAATMITAAGGINAVDGYDGYRPLTAESVLEAKPDIILVTHRSLGAVKGEAGLWKTPGVALTPAGKNKKLIIMDDLKLLGFGPRTGVALEELRQGFFQPQK